MEIQIPWFLGNYGCLHQSSPRLSMLPDDIIEDILSRLSVKTLLRFKTVSRSWYSMINNPQFIDMHLQNSCYRNDAKFVIKMSSSTLYSIDSEIPNQIECITYPKIFGNNGDILGSCDGVLCITGHPDGNFMSLLNPSTRQYAVMQYPFPRIRRSFYAHNIAHGLGYDQVIGSYKLVKIISSCDSLVHHSEVMIYSFGTSSWVKSENINYKSFYPKAGKVVNNYIHWLATSYIDGSSFSKSVIVSFDLANESFQEVPLPKAECGKLLSLNFTELGGCLCVVRNYDLRFEMWLMTDYRIKDSWTKFELEEGLRSSSLEIVAYVESLAAFQPDSNNSEVMGPQQIIGRKKRTGCNGDLWHCRNLNEPCNMEFLKSKALYFDNRTKEILDLVFPDCGSSLVTGLFASYPLVCTGLSIFSLSFLFYLFLIFTLGSSRNM